MDRNCMSSLSDHSCPILCLTKAVLFVLISLFVLFLPLGDPNFQCSPNGGPQARNPALFCLCDVYKYIIKTSNRLSEILDMVLCKTSDALYEAKLQFYSLLEKLDRNDLCRHVCCSSNADGEDPEQQDKRPRPVCKCIKHSCCKPT